MNVILLQARRATLLAALVLLTSLSAGSLAAAPAAKDAKGPAVKAAGSAKTGYGRYLILRIRGKG